MTCAGGGVGMSRGVFARRVHFTGVREVEQCMDDPNPMEALLKVFMKARRAQRHKEVCDAAVREEMCLHLSTYFSVSLASYVCCIFLR